MKRSELKEAIKAEIKSVLSENRYDINDPNSPLGKLNDEYESSGLKGIVDKYGLDVVLMMLSSGEYGDRLNEAMSDEEREDKLQQAKRGGGKEEMDPLNVYNRFYKRDIDKLDKLDDIIDVAENEVKAADEFLKDTKFDLVEQDLGDKLKNLPDDIDPDAMAEGGRPGKGLDYLMGV